MTVRTEYALVPTDGGTCVEQATTVEAPWWIAGFVFRTARAAHDATGERLRARLAGG